MRISLILFAYIKVIASRFDGTNTLIRKFNKQRWRDFYFSADAATFVFVTDDNGTDYGYRLQLRECN